MSADKPIDYETADISLRFYFSKTLTVSDGFRNSLIQKSYKIHNMVEHIEVVTVRVAIRMHPRERYTQFAAWILFSLYH